jgi:hypothetical protein
MPKLLLSAAIPDRSSDRPSLILPPNSRAGRRSLLK